MTTAPRREFLYGLGSSLGALALTDLQASEAKADGPLVPKQPMHDAKAKAVIMLFMEGGPSQGPVSFTGGRMVGVSAGRTVVQADFDGVPTEKGLEVTVTATVDVDEIRLTPAPVSILLGETIAMDAVGYKNGKSVGQLIRRKISVKYQ